MSAAERDRLAPLLRAAEASPGAWLVFVGPTASGKSALALATAEALGGEIVSADSVQIVRGFDIGSGKPSRRERALVPHHLIDAVDPLDVMNASEYAKLADEAAREIERRGKRVIVCGGTFLWVRALLYGLVAAPAADDAIRAAHRALVEREGRAALHQKLAAVDAPSAERLHPNDFVRVSRALEVFQTTGQRMSDLMAGHGFRSARVPALLFGATRSPEELAARIEARASEWLAAGWLEETEALLAKGYGAARAMSSVGYREVAMHLRGELSRAELLPAIVRSTKLYARRQRTFLRQTDVAWLSALGF